MIEYTNGGRLVQSISELPNFINCTNLYMDLETTSGSPKLDSLNPWHNCDIAGIGITVDDCPNAYYVPVGHSIGGIKVPGNLPKEVIYKWVAEIVDSTDCWINHNPKYDAHVLKNCANIDPPKTLIDTVTLSKIIDSDRVTKGGYGLDVLSKAWLKHDISKYELAMKPYLNRNKDYGEIPIDIIGEYGCQDVFTGRQLYRYIKYQCPEQCNNIWETEIELTRILYEMERRGMCVDPMELKITSYKTLKRICEIQERLQELTGRAFRPHVNVDCFDVLCNQYGLPILGLTDTGNPSFDKAALAAYQVHPQAPAEVIDLIIDVRELITLNNFFLEPYQKIHVNGVMHPSYNQCVRTGRMSCKQPNAQQLNTIAKSLIHPHEGYSYLSMDYSQIEFRIIVHYIKDKAAIEAYQKDKRTDFHSWVAEMCGIPRKPAKNMNFMMGYGGGKAKCVSMLAGNKHIVGDFLEKLEAKVSSGELDTDRLSTMFKMLCQRKGEEVYNKYHDTLPGLKLTSRQAANRVKERGYVWNLYGRRRHLPLTLAYIAFNTVCQSSAADLMKERIVALYKMLRGTDIHMVANVHDELVLEVPNELTNDERMTNDIVNCLETPSIDLRVPICMDVGISSKNWAKASEDHKAWVSGLAVGRLEHLRQGS